MKRLATLVLLISAICGVYSEVEIVCGDELVQQLTDDRIKCVEANTPTIDRYIKLLGPHIKGYKKSKSYTFDTCLKNALSEVADEDMDMVCIGLMMIALPCECASKQCTRDWLKSHLAYLTARERTPECQDPVKLCNILKVIDSGACASGIQSARLAGYINDEKAVRDIFEGGCAFTCDGTNGVFPGKFARLRHANAVVSSAR